MTRPPSSLPARLFLVAPVLLATPTALCAQERSHRLVVGPEVRVSRNDLVPYVEPMLAAHPSDSNRLLAAAIAVPPYHGTTEPVFLSDDGGATWQPADVPGLTMLGLADPVLAFGADGVAYFAAITRSGPGGMLFFRSADAGRTWSEPLRVRYHDHPQLGIDGTTSPRRGTIYLAGMTADTAYVIHVFRSDDGGRTFEGPVTVARSTGSTGLNTVGMTVLRDGSVLVTYVDFSTDFAQRKASLDMTLWIVQSSDGGRTFSPARKVITMHHGSGRVLLPLGTV